MGEDDQDQKSDGGETTTDVSTPGGTEVHEEQGGSEPAPEPEPDGE